MDIPVITLLTDFGGSDGYVAAMKGVIASLAPHAHVVDAAHDIAPHDIQAAAWTLNQYWSLYPKGTIHIAVVDPGVGTSRKALCIDADGRLLLAPDNGITSLAVEHAEQHAVYAIKDDVHRPGMVSATFHGRDIFAYVAGLIAGGVQPLADIAEPLAEIVRPPWARPRSSPTRIEGEIIHIDHFGNLVSNIHRNQMPEADWAVASVRVGAQIMTRVRHTYADVASGSIVALFGSANTLEIAINGRSAHTGLGCGRGTKIHVEKGLLANFGTTVG